MAIQGNIRFPKITPYISTLFIGLRLRVNETEAAVLLSILDYITQKLSLSLSYARALLQLFDSTATKENRSVLQGVCHNHTNDQKM